MYDFAVHYLIVKIQMGNVQIAHGLNGERQRPVGAAGLLRPLQPPACCPKDAQDTSPIEALTLTVITETHGEVISHVHGTGEKDLT